MIVWVIRPFLHSSVYSCHFFLVPSASVKSLPFQSFIVPILTWNGPLIVPVSLKRSLVFPTLLFSFISLHCSFKVFLTLLAILWISAFSWVHLSLSPLPLLLFFSQVFVRPPQTTLLHFFLLGLFWSLLPIQCFKPPSTVLQALYLSDLVPWVYFLLPLYNHKGSDLGHTWMVCRNDVLSSQKKHFL